MQSDDLVKIIEAKSEYISSQKKSIEEYLNSNPEDQETAVFLDFSWLYDKFQYLWLTSKEVECYIKSRSTNIDLFSPLDFEKLIQSLFLILTGDFYKTTPSTNDGGIDLFHSECIDPTWNAFSHSVIQCKLYRGSVAVSEIRDFFGVMVSKTATGFFVTTGDFTKSCRGFAESTNYSSLSNRLYLIDKNKLNKLLEIGSKITELSYADEDYQKEITKLQKDGLDLLYSNEYKLSKDKSQISLF